MEYATRDTYSFHNICHVKYIHYWHQTRASDTAYTKKEHLINSNKFK